MCAPEVARSRWLSHQFVAAAALECALVRRPPVDALQEVPQLRSRPGVEAGALGGGLERKTHLDVGGAELFTREPARLAELALHVVQVLLELRQHEGAQHVADDRLRDRLGEERHRRAPNAVEHQLHQQGRHGRTLGIVHPVEIAQALLGIGRRPQAALAVALDQVLQDRAGLRQHAALVLDHRRLAQRMHATQFGRGQHGARVALIASHFVLKTEFFQQPEDSLRARVVEVVHDDHGRAGFLQAGRGRARATRRGGRVRYPDCAMCMQVPGRRAPGPSRDAARPMRRGPPRANACH